MSPLFFYNAMMRLPSELRDINSLEHTIKVDGITLWSKTCTTGKQPDALPEAIDLSESYLRACGLLCAPEKTDLLILKARTRGRPPAHELSNPAPFRVCLP